MVPKMPQNHKEEWIAFLALRQGVKNFQKKAESEIGFKEWLRKGQEKSFQVDGTHFLC